MRLFREIWWDGRTDGHLATMLQSRIETGVSLHMSKVLCMIRNEWIFTSSAESEHEFNATVGCFQCFGLHWSLTAFPSRTPRGLISKFSKLEHWDGGFDLNSSQGCVSAYFLNLFKFRMKTGLQSIIHKFCSSSSSSSSSSNCRCCCFCFCCGGNATETNSCVLLVDWTA